MREPTLGDAFKIGNAMISDANNYEDRKVGRDEVNGLIVSTCYTSDQGFETALIDKNHVYPVERYTLRRMAVEGHARWCEFAKGNENKITKLGYDDVIEDTVIVLERRSSSEQSNKTS
jgi:hypothetical protein